MNIKHLLPAAALLSAVMLSSCFGVSADISIRPDGSGRIRMEYRVSAMAEALGRLDGNQRWQTVPVGRADFERTLARLPGIKLVSFSGKTRGGVLVNRVVLDFTGITALTSFLDGAGTGNALYSREHNSLKLILHKGLPDADEDLLSLLRELSQDYTIQISLSAPQAASLVLTDGAGNAIDVREVPAVNVLASGKKVSLTIGTGELLSLPAGLGMEIAW